MRLLAILFTSIFAMPAHAEPTIDDLSFLTGHWRGGDENFTFEETWSAPAGGVMTAMARGVSDGEARVLEYIIVSAEADGLVMRFKHFNADFSSWEEGAEPLTLLLSEFEGTDATFTADPPSHTVTSIRYWLADEDTLHVDVKQIEDGEPGGFSLVFDRMH